jgi:DNA-binding CsgD family transcriptional regulator
MQTNTHFHITNPNRVIRSLSNEWQILERDPENVRRTSQWNLAGTAPETLCDLAMRAGLGQGVDQSTADAFLYDLVCVAVTQPSRSEDAKLASRIVIQRLLPGLISIASRRGRICDGGFDEAFGRILTETWSTIIEFPTERRKQKIAVNILRDSESRAFWRHDRAARVEASRKDIFRAEYERTADENLNNEWMRESAWEFAHENLAGQNLDVFKEMFAGVSSAETASRLGLTERAVRYHRTAVTNQLRSLVLRSRSELVTTNTLDPAIANPAIIGSSTPVAASGNAATL